MSALARRVAIAVAAIVALGASGIVCQRVGERGRWALPYSTHGSGPEGTRALYLLAAREGAAPQRWTEDLGRLPEGAMMVALGGCDSLSSRPLARPEREHLVRWIEAGGTLLVAGAPDYLPAELGVTIDAPSFEDCLGQSGLVGMVVRSWRRAEGAEDEGGDEDALRIDDRTAEEIARSEAEALPEPAWASAVAPPLAGMSPVGLRRAATIAVRAGTDAAVLLAIDGATAGVSVRRGRGTVIALASASALQNRDLVASSGAVLFARLVREHGGPVLFDEYHLGAGERRSFMRYVAQLGLMPIALQLLIVALFFTWRAGARFGAPRRPLEVAPEATASFALAVGALFAKSEDRAGALAIVARHALQRIAAHHRIELHDAPRLADELRRRRHPDAASAVLAIEALGRAPGGARVDLARVTKAIDVEVARATRDSV